MIIFANYQPPKLKHHARLRKIITSTEQTQLTCKITQLLQNAPASARSCNPQNGVFKPSSPKTKSSKTNAYCFLFRGDGIRTHGGIAPTQPFQDCTLNLSDTPLFEVYSRLFSTKVQNSQSLVLIFCFFYDFIVLQSWTGRVL